MSQRSITRHSNPLLAHRFSSICPSKTPSNVGGVEKHFGALEVVAHAHGDSCLMAIIVPGPLCLCMLAAVSILFGH